MAKKKTAAITGVGAYLPDYILDNIELSHMVDTSDEWIMSRIGIKTRHILKGEGLGTSYMTERAVKDLLEKTNTDPLDIEMVVCATVTPDMFFPSTANLTCYKTGMKNAFGFDLSAACSGFLFALNTAAKYIETGTFKKVVVIGADKMSSIINYNDRNTCPIFGDGAAAVLLEQRRHHPAPPAGAGCRAALGRRRRPTPVHEGRRLGLPRHARNGREQLALCLSGRSGRVQGRRIEHGRHLGRSHGTQQADARRHHLPGPASGQSADHRRDRPPYGPAARKVHDQHRQVR